MNSYFETGEYPVFFPAPGLRKGRSPRDGYSRGWGLEYGGLRDAVLADPVYAEAMALAAGRTIQATDCRMNLFLLLKYFFPPLLEQSGKGSIVEFGSYRGGSSIFLAAVCERLKLDVRVFGLDTFEGMPPTDKSIDAHYAGNFSDVDLSELRAHVERCGLAHRLEFIQGLFQNTAPRVLESAGPVLLAHIDCDVYAAVAETGSLVIRPNPHHGLAISLVPPIHIALVEPATIGPDLIDLLEKIRLEPHPPNVTVITGPSKTADIEGALVTGVHGPGLVQVFLVRAVDSG